jgi:hypothetical protein
MAKLNTLNGQVKRLNSVARGEFVKFQGAYVTNAFEGVYVQTDDAAWIEVPDIYHVSVEKIDGAYRIYAEEHEPSDIEQPKEGFATLKAAKIAAVEFGEWFEACWNEHEG